MAIDKALNIGALWSMDVYGIEHGHKAISGRKQAPMATLSGWWV